MRVQVIVPMAIVVSVAMLGVIKQRQKERVRQERSGKFHEIKLRVSEEVLDEYLKEKEETQSQMEKVRKQQMEMENLLKTLQAEPEKKKEEEKKCQGDKKKAVDELAASQAELENFPSGANKEKSAWEAEVASLKQQLEAASELCKYVKPESALDKMLCNNAIKEEEKKADVKPEPPKQEEAKQEDAKPEPPKQEEAKQEDAKPEPPKQEEAKQEDAKPEPPKQEEAKQEDAKPEPPKQEEAKQEDAKPEPPKQEDAKPEAPKNR